MFRRRPLTAKMPLFGVECPPPLQRPVWEGVTIIPDEVTKAKAGQIVITAVMLFAMKVLRTGAGLVKQGTDHA